VAAWDVLDRESIRTVDELRKHADRLERFDGIGSRMAQVIRQELEHVVSSDERTSGQEQTDSWGA
jgi:Holliday junction resolvasome RuvABC DNA-binding subunit